MNTTNIPVIYPATPMVFRHPETCLEQALEQLNLTAQRIQDAAELDTTLATAATGAWKILGCDRALIYRFLPGGDGVVIAEAANHPWPTAQGQLIYDPCFETKWHLKYQQGCTSSLTDRDAANLPSCYHEMLERLRVQANLVVPILLPSEQPLPELWGLLIAHECEQPRQWHASEIQILRHIAMQVGLKIQSLQILQSGSSDNASPEPGSSARETIAAPPSSPTLESETNETAIFQAFDRLQTPIWVFDIEQLRVHWANQASLSLWNASHREELLKRDFNDISDAVQIRLQSYLEQFQQGKTLKEQWTFYPKGQPVTVQCQCSGILIENGRLAMLVEGTIAPSHQIDQDTQRSIEALRHTSVMISLYTLEGEVLLQNPAALHCYGDAQPSQPSEKDAFLRHFVDARVGLRALEILKAGEVLSIEAQMLTRQGIRWHGIDARCIKDPITGKAVILVNEQDMNAQHVALSDRLHAEAELEAQRVFLRQIIDTVPSSIFVKSQDGRFQVANQASADVHGSTVDRMIGKHEVEFNPNFEPAQLEQFMATNRDVMSSRQPQQVIQQITTAAGEVRWYQTTIRPWVDGSDRVRGVIGNAVDITELKQAEVALREKSQRLATIITVQQDIALNHPNLDAVMAVIVEHTQNLTQAAGAAIAFLDGDELVYRTGSGATTDLIGLRIKTATSLSGHCIAAKAVLQCDDTETDPRVDRAACRRFGMRSMVVVPLLSAGTCVGMLKVFSPIPAAFKEQDAQTLQLMAGFLSASIQLAAEFESKNALLYALQESEDRYRSVVATMTEGVVLQQADGQITACNLSAEAILGLTQDQMMGRTSIDPCWHAIHEDGSPFPGETHPAILTLRTGQPQRHVVMGIHKPNGNLTWISINSQPLLKPGESNPYAVVTSFVDITTQKQAEDQLRHQTERERMIYAIAQHIRQSLDLDNILTATVTDVRQFLQTDRVIIFRFSLDWSGTVVTESLAPGWKSILNMEIRDTYFVEHHEHVYRKQSIQAWDDIYAAGLNSCHIELLEQFQVKAKLVVPIWQGDTLWGLLIVHQCQGPRYWNQLECDLLLQLATQLEIAIQQSELYHQVQHLNTHLECQVQERTAQLQQSLNFEALLKRITDRVRDSLNEQEILQSAVLELSRGLGTICCDTGIYNPDQTTSTIAYEVNGPLDSAEGTTFAIATAPHREVYGYLLEGEVCQFCGVAPNSLRSRQELLSVLACPIVDDQGVLGDLWLFKPAEISFDDIEVRLVQQVANQCAIALRQSRLYRAAQTQVEELARLNQLKDDFLSTVSHELRTPISNMQMALQMLDICLRPLGLLEPDTNTLNSNFQILQTECQREMNLVNDLLDLARIDSGSEPLGLSSIPLQHWVPHIAEPFTQRTYHQNQQLEIRIAEDLPTLTTDFSYLERALTELLHNAFKYTPPQETISVSVYPYANPQGNPQIRIEVTNSGVEIPQEECDRIFDKFYRIPNNDPWKHGGTGLGLALVKKLMEQLGGTIGVESGNQRTRFILQLPL